MVIFVGIADGEGDSPGQNDSAAGRETGGDTGARVAATDDDGDGFTEDDGDCDDSDSAVYPDAPDAWYDGTDSDCGGKSDYDSDGTFDAFGYVESYVRAGCSGTCTATGSNCGGVFVLSLFWEESGYPTDGLDWRGTP